MGYVLVMIFLIVLALVPNTRGEGLDTYKWRSIVHDQLPYVSIACENQCVHLFGMEDTFSFHDLLHVHSSERGGLCDGIVSPHIGDFDMCSTIEEQAIENFLCYEYDVSNADTPPISKTCAMRYWECSQVQGFFLELLSGKQQKRVCDQMQYYSMCILTKTSPVTECRMSTTDLCGGANAKTNEYLGCDGILQECFLWEYSTVFEMLLEMKNSADQSYLCGRLEECLVKPDNNIVTGPKCSMNEARVVDEFLCTNTTFTPDAYGLFLLDKLCRKSFYRCYSKTSISELETDPTRRRSLCRSRQLYSPCFTKLKCTRQQVDIIHNFLCYDLDDNMLRVSGLCRDSVVYCNEDVRSSHVDITYVEMFGRGLSKQEWCEKLPFLWQCVDGGVYCTENEKKYLEDYLCVSACNREPVTSGLFSGLFFFLVLTI